MATTEPEAPKINPTEAPKRASGDAPKRASGEASKPTEAPKRTSGEAPKRTSGEAPKEGEAAEVPKASSSDKQDGKGKKHKGQKKGEDLSDEVIKKGKPETLPQDLAGTLQNLFTQTEAAEAPALKPLRRPKLIYMNTYRLNAYKPFHHDSVLKVLETTLEEMLAKMKYTSVTSNQNDVAMKIAEKVRARVLSFRFDRYKIIVLAHFGPLFRQGLHIGMKCLWDPLRDSYVSHTFKNTYIYCNCSVYGIYFE